MSQVEHMAYIIYTSVCICPGDLALNIIKGPLEALLGVVFGIVAGVFVWFFPGKDSVSILIIIVDCFV